MKIQEPIKLMYLMDDFRGPKGGGTEVQFINLLESLKPEQVQPEIVVLRSSEFTKSMHHFPFPVNVLNITKLLSIITLFKMIKLAIKIRRDSIQIVHIYFNDAAIIAPVFCKIGGAKVIVSRRDMGFWYTKAKLSCLYISNIFVDHIITNSHSIKVNVNKQEKFSLDKISVIYNGVNTSSFLNIEKGTLRGGYNIDSKYSIVGMVANLDKIKRHTDLIQALHIINKEFPYVKLIFAGHGSEETNLRQYAHDLNIDDKIIFIGNVDNVIPIVCDFDICVLCSESEGLSNAIIEYLGCGKPVICTNTGGNPELITDGSNGFLVNVGDVAGIVDKLRIMFSNRKLLTDLGEHARSSFMGKFTMQNMTMSHMDKYYQLLNTN